jgi:CheY-like chemotaxis protein
MSALDDENGCAVGAEKPSCGRVVLLVEDDEDLRTILAEALGDHGLTVAVAADGVEALEYLSSHPAPDFLLLDLMMPRMSGVELLQRLRGRTDLAAVRTVVLTAGQTANADVLIELGVARILRKPIEMQRLLAALEVEIVSEPRP